MVNLLVRKYNAAIDYLTAYRNQRSFKNNKVQYDSFPMIMGRMIITNHGELTIGGNVSFINESIYNMVGIFKPCTLAVLEGAQLTIGNNSGFSGVSIYCSNKITIGSYVNCGGNVCIWDTNFHPLDYQSRRLHIVEEIRNAPIVIEDDVFIGANSIILKGVTIGQRSIVAAGSVVTTDIPANQIWGGNPAGFIRQI